MATDCAMLEVSNEDNEIELSLELSIGRGYKRSKPENSKSTSLCVKDRAGVPEKIFRGETGVDFHSKREMQALRRQEAKKKREEKMKKTTNCVNGIEARARERDVEEDVRNRKREKIENVVVGNKNGGIGDLNLALKTGSCSVGPLVQLRNCGMVYNPDHVNKCWHQVAGNVNQAEVKALIPANSQPCQRNVVLNDDGSDHGSAGCSSSAVSDYQSSPGTQQGLSGAGSSTDSSNSAKPKQNLNTNAPTHYSEHVTASSSFAPTIKSVEPAPGPRPGPRPVSVPVTNHLKQHNIEAGKAQTENAKETVSRPQMPCVSATGNGPNGKTINGLLYRYTKTEVTIVCVCHGSSFSPAGFVEHAGGVDIAHPLKHITVVPSAF